MTINANFPASAHITELDTTRTLSAAEVDDYSIRYYIQKRLNAWNWTVAVKDMDEGWPDFDEVALPGVYVDVNRSRDVAGVELGSNGSRLLVVTQIIGQNPAQRTRLAELVEDIFRDTVPIYSFVTGNETDPTPTEGYFITDDVGWQKVPSVYTGSDNQRYRANVNAVLRRAE
jgi:hypothetical protein